MTLRPHDAILVALVLAMIAPPVAHLAGAPGVGSFSMFSAPREYRLRISIVGGSGAAEPVALRSLAAHLSRDARRVIVPASTWRMGETSLELLHGGLDDLGDLVCALRREARRVEVVLEERGVPPPRTTTRSARCARR